MARERYLLHAGEEEINKPGAEKIIKTRKQKWQNFWYYHKIHVIIIAAAVFVLGIFIKDIMSNVKPDYQIAMITEKPYSEESILKLQNEVTKYADDFNKDGKVNVLVLNYVIPADESKVIDPNIQMANVTKFQADLAAGSSMIFITDDVSFNDKQKQLNLFSYLDGKKADNSASDFENMRIKLKDCKNISGLPQEMKDLSISLRNFESSDSSNKKYYEASKNLLKKFTQ